MVLRLTKSKREVWEATPREAKGFAGASLPMINGQYKTIYKKSYSKLQVFEDFKWKTKQTTNIENLTNILIFPKTREHSKEH